MENEEARQDILLGISTDAEAQANKLISDARDAASQRLEAVRRQAARIVAEAEEKTSKQISVIERETSTRVKAAKRRMQLEMKEKAYQAVIARCIEELKCLINSEEYGKILENWIVQAAAGLRAESTVVNCSALERDAVRAVLKSAEAAARAAAGQPIALTLSDDPPLAGQGIVVTSSDGRIAFNNQIESRLFRFQTEIWKLIHDRLFIRT